MSNLTTIVSFLESKGLTKHAIAGILGNMQTESSLNTSALNQREGAIGLVQWEGGRRTALQQYAAQHGTSETDINAQLGFMWQEMNQRGIIPELNASGSASQAASIWDQKFEVSSGSSRGQRISNAQSYETTGTLAGASNTAATAGASSGGGLAPDAVPTLTKSQKQQAIQSGAGELYSLATAVPELKGLLADAINKGLTAQEFQNEVTNTSWYRQHADTVRTQMALKASDPATYAKNVAQARAHVEAVAHSLGVGTGAATGGITLQYLAGGWNDEQLVAYLGNSNNHLNWAGASGGAMETALNKYQQIASDYGVPVSGATLQWWARKSAVGDATEDEFVKQMQNTAASVYPGLKAQLASGQTVKQLADPYVQTMATTLELNPQTIKWSQDPLIKKALQTPVTSAAGAGQKTSNNGTGQTGPETPGTTPIWQFEEQLRSDPRWQNTNGAKAATASMLSNLGHDWGFST